ncbi:aldo/keto reductase [Duganella sp.]|uniref:aldo/keto reductase n=1 Tax=Duganella sp. TaxID=1904440 RepID=UPI0031DB79FD
MKYLHFGRRTGLRVSELALGTGNFGTGWGYGSERGEAKEVFDGYVAAGGNFIDTANVYQVGQAEELVGDFIAADRDYFVLATKYTLGVSPTDGLSRTGNSRRNLVHSVEASLKRLKTDRIDLLWAHMADGATPLDEILRGFDDLVRAGKIHYAGLSNFPAWMVSRADLLAELRGWSPVAGLQVEYSLAERGADREFLPMAEALGLGAALWSPLGGGLLTGKYRDGSKEGRLTGLGGALVRTEKGDRETAILDAVLAIAQELDATPSHIAIAWLLDKARKSSTGLVPILGSRTRAQLEGTLGAIDLQLSAGQVQRLNQASAIVMGNPYDILAQSAGSIAGGNAELLRKQLIPPR